MTIRAFIFTILLSSITLEMLGQDATADGQFEYLATKTKFRIDKVIKPLKGLFRIKEEHKLYNQIDSGCSFTIVSLNKKLLTIELNLSDTTIRRTFKGRYKHNKFRLRAVRYINGIPPLLWLLGFESNSLSFDHRNGKFFWTHDSGTTLILFLAPLFGAGPGESKVEIKQFQNI